MRKGRGRREGRVRSAAISFLSPLGEDLPESIKLDLWRLLSPRAIPTLGMPAFYLRRQGHTIACALREELEQRHPDEFVSCTVLHPLDEHVVVEAPDEAAVREALLEVLDKVRACREEVRRSKKK